MKAGIKVGYMVTREVRPDVYAPHYTERNYLGDVLNNTRRWEQSGNQTNDNIGISNRISIIADPYAITNQNNIRYVTFMGVKWFVSSIEWQAPRIILTLGGVYNVPDEDSAELQARANAIYSS